MPGTFTLNGSSFLSQSNWVFIGPYWQLNLSPADIAHVFDAASVLATSGHGTVTVGTAPVGFTPTTNLVGNTGLSIGTPSGFSATLEIGGASRAVVAADKVLGFHVAIPDGTSFLALWSAFVSAAVLVTSGLVTVTPTAIQITGDYEIRAWFFDGTEYFYGEDPGGAYVEVDHPTPVIDSMAPNNGPIAGGTAFTILGDGFLGPDGTPSVEGVTFDGEFPATSVVVVNQHTITGVTPAHWKGGVDVVVTLDFTP